MNNRLMSNRLDQSDGQEEVRARLGLNLGLTSDRRDCLAPGQAVAIAAPMAPHRGRVRHLTSAPAIPIAPATVCAAIFYSSWLVLLRRLEYCSALDFFFFSCFSSCSSSWLVAYRVDDREQHEYVRLDQPNSEIEGLPYDSKGPSAFDARAATTTIIRPPENRLPKRRSVNVMAW